MPAEAVLNPLSTYCFVLESGQVVVDTADANAPNLLPFWGQVVLMEIEEQSEGEIWASPFVSGTFIGTLYGPEEDRRPTEMLWHAMFLPFLDRVRTKPESVGVWAQAREIPIPDRRARVPMPEEQAESDVKLLRLAREKYPKLASESDEQWISRAIDSWRKEPLPDLRDLGEFVSSFIDEWNRLAAEQTRLSPRCKILGRVVMYFPLAAKEEAEK
jgi:hypothetical protein